MRAQSAISSIVILAATAGPAAAEEVLRIHRFDTVGIERLHITSSVRGDRLTLSFGEDDVHSYMLVRVPSLEKLTIDAGAGEVQGTLPPMETEVFLVAGTVNLDVDRSSTGRIDLRARIGDTAIDGAQNVETSRVILIGSTSSAIGEGSHRVQARVRAGDVRVGLH
jgi:hypothetical protein